ncbi:MAG: hypothetical protein Sylvanvirus28_10 [Sylvanvirus sp.]|uniref:Uncharacterized protein n=1 Tax=Sylvanvirus sp. TaxID=2487774 RepID=A0A3G5AJ05_9VIRU|nr:MAG: hypothetical protein Sylvanvirus28_10 [Sylvanvirus sp.]
MNKVHSNTFSDLKIKNVSTEFIAFSAATYTLKLVYKRDGTAFEARQFDEYCALITEMQRYVHDIQPPIVEQFKATQRIHFICYSMKHFLNELETIHTFIKLSTRTQNERINQSQLELKLNKLCRLSSTLALEINQLRFSKVDEKVDEKVDDSERLTSCPSIVDFHDPLVYQDVFQFNVTEQTLENVLQFISDFNEALKNPSLVLHEIINHFKCELEKSSMQMSFRIEELALSLRKFFFMCSKDFEITPNVRIVFYLFVLVVLFVIGRLKSHIKCEAELIDAFSSINFPKAQEGGVGGQSTDPYMFKVQSFYYDVKHTVSLFKP